jgi:hypothetical protein
VLPVEGAAAPVGPLILAAFVVVAVEAGQDLLSLAGPPACDTGVDVLDRGEVAGQGLSLLRLEVDYLTTAVSAMRIFGQQPGAVPGDVPGVGH